MNTKNEVIDGIDVTFDANEVINSYKKLARLVFLCVSSKKNMKKALAVQDLFDLEEKKIKFNSGSFVTTFHCYETKGAHNNECKLEIRYEILSKLEREKEAKERIKGTIDLFDKLENSVEEFEKEIVPVLLYNYHNEIKNGTLANFTGFMDKYGDYIYTKNIFDGVYEGSELNGSANNWLKKFRKSRPNALKFHSKESVKIFSAEVKRHLRRYIKTL